MDVFSESRVRSTDIAFSEQVFNNAVTEIEPEAEPDSVRDGTPRESMAFLCVHELILAISVQLIWQYLISSSMLLRTSSGSK